MIYIVSVMLAQGTMDLCSGSDSNSDVCTHFGTLTRTMLSVYEALLGGLLWGTLMTALEELEVFYRVIFLAFMSFSIIVMLNIVSGVLHEHQRHASDHERQTVIQREMQEVHEYMTCMRH